MFNCICAQNRANIVLVSEFGNETHIVTGFTVLLCAYLITILVYLKVIGSTGGRCIGERNGEIRKR